MLPSDHTASVSVSVSASCVRGRSVLRLPIASVDAAVVEFAERVVNTQIARAAVMKRRDAAVIVVMLVVMVVMSSAASACTAAGAVAGAWTTLTIDERRRCAAIVDGGGRRVWAVQVPLLARSLLHNVPGDNDHQLHEQEQGPGYHQTYHKQTKTKTKPKPIADK